MISTNLLPCRITLAKQGMASSHERTDPRRRVNDAPKCGDCLAIPMLEKMRHSQELESPIGLKWIETHGEVQPRNRFVVMPRMHKAYSSYCRDISAAGTDLSCSFHKAASLVMTPILCEG